jgi:acetate kinase
MRTLEASDSPAAARAIDYFVYRARLELGAMAAALGGIDALVFCGGIGENSPRIRRLICEHQAWIGIDLDQAANQRHASVISSAGSPTTVMVIPTREDRVIARAARRVASSALPRSEPVAASRSCQ